MTESLSRGATGDPGRPSHDDLLAEMETLGARLEEAEDTLRALRQGEVDALVVLEKHSEKVYTLKSADRPYRLMIEEMGQGTVTLLPDGTVLYCNRCFASMVETPLENVLGASIYDFAAPASRELFASLLRAGEEGEPGKGEAQLLSATGGLIPAYVSVTALPREEGPALFAVVTDLTWRKAAAAAEAANQAKDQFLATLSHELRTPLTPVLAMVSGLETDERLPDDVRSRLAMMRRNLELEARLIDDMLDLTRIARGKLELKRQAADLRQILEHALDTMGPDFLGKRLQVVTALATADCRLAGDAPRLTQVFWNLFHNAAKFTPEGGALTVSSRREPAAAPGTDWLVVEISDTGIGIEEDTMVHIFDAFDQGSPGTTSRFGGLGLGLAICKTIVEMHGGSLDVFSAGRNRGSTFTVRLPATEPPAATPKEAVPNQHPEPRAAGSPHILLIEDHVDTAEAMAELLRGLGYEITVAGSVSAALAAAESCQSGQRIDLVVSDLGLPDGNGLDLMRVLATRHGLRGIALSGYGMEMDIQHSREAGFERHLTKPVSLQALQTALQAVLG